MSADVGLDPVDEELFREREQMEESRNLGQEFETLVIDRANEMYYRLGTHMSESTLEGLMAGVSAIVNLDKSRWISFRGGVSDGELLSLERLQSRFREYVDPVLMTKLVKDFFLVPAVRELMLRDIAL